MHVDAKRHQENHQEHSANDDTHCGTHGQWRRLQAQQTVYSMMQQTSRQGTCRQVGEDGR